MPDQKLNRKENKKSWRTLHSSRFVDREMWMVLATRLELL